jgi:uncharacterized caspase-like protein
MRLLALILLSVISVASTAHAQKRVALVIGNAAYKNAVTLQNPRNDANDIAVSLTRLNFSVTKVIDGTFDDMRHALLQFGRDAVGADMAVIYYSGHGMEIGGENWLIPIDAELLSDNDAESEAIPLKSAMLQAAHGSSLGLVILDACRNNPFAAKMQRSARYRSVDRGLVRVEPSDNVLVAYAAREGTIASDGDGKHSPFTTALLNNIETPGLEITFLFRNVRDEVLSATKREQQPFVYGSLSKQAIYLKEPLGTVQDAAPSNQPSQTEAAQAWAATQNTTSQAVLEDFIKRYGDSFYGTLARARLDELKKSQVAVAQPITPDDKPNVQRTLGMQLANMSDDLRKRYKIKDGISGVVISGVDSSSAAAGERLSAGDVIVEVAQEAVSNATDLQKRIDKLKKDGRRTALLQVAHPNGERQFVALPILSQVTTSPPGTMPPPGTSFDEFFEKFNKGK